MVFHGRQLQDSLKSKIGNPVRRANTYRVYTGAVTHAGPAGLDDSNPVDPDPEQPPPIKRQLSNDNWRVARAICSRDKKVDQVSLERDTLTKSNIALNETVIQQKATVKKPEHGKYVYAKAYQTAAIEKEDAHKLPLPTFVRNLQQK